MRREITCAHCGLVKLREVRPSATGQPLYCGRRCARRARVNVPIEERFWALVNKDGPIIRPELGPCWEWRLKPDPQGYGHFHVVGRGGSFAHRFSWELANGPIPAGSNILHACDNRICVNPAHLRPGTALDNMRDKVSRGRANVPHGEAHGMAKLTELAVIAIRTAFGNGVTMAALAAQYHTSAGAIHQIIHGDSWSHVPGALPPGSSTRRRGARAASAKLTEAEVLLMRDCYANGVATLADLSARFGVATRTIFQAVHGETWTELPNAVPSDRSAHNGSIRHHDRLQERAAKRAHLTAPQVQEIRARYSTGGITQGALAAAYGVSAFVIHDVVRRKTWSHLP